jgi:hypothetical protein
MVAQLVAGVRMDEHVQGAMVEREPADTWAKSALAPANW